MLYKVRQDAILEEKENALRVSRMTKEKDRDVGGDDDNDHLEGLGGERSGEDGESGGEDSGEDGTEVSVEEEIPMMKKGPVKKQGKAGKKNAPRKNKSKVERDGDDDDVEVRDLDLSTW
eukprot:TRINITY_DN1940_c0_g1_i1.p1 TRINITY_DN1940_c0_g1~~TRINITY_DN1940_c0_g1_i1.p1  ORF type:complete len:119 (+),score=47.44 TRINITY_DN1940_c0_g1_i1:797-1153(+)